MKYTKGPWAWVNGSLVTALPDGTISLNSTCIMYKNLKTGELEAPKRADAQLIAKAPELLIALQKLLINEAQIEDARFRREFLQEIRRLVYQIEWCEMEGNGK